MNRIYGPGPGPAPALRPVRDLAGSRVDDNLARPVGEVYGTLVDAETGLLRYLDVALETGRRHVLVPIGHVRIEPDHGTARVVLQAATREDLHAVPTYDPAADGPGEEHQREVLAAHGRIYYGERYYAHPAYDHSGLFAGDHPIVRDGNGEVEPRPDGGPRLARLTESAEFRVAPGEPDIRGWVLVTRDGETAAAIRDLVFDPDAMKVRYVVVRPTGTNDHVLLPVGLLRVERDARRVHVPALAAGDLGALPAWSGPAVTEADEARLRERLDTLLDGDRRFGRPDFNGGAQSLKKPTPNGPSARSRK